MTYSKFLRAVLKLDAATCLAMAALLIPAGNPLAELLGIPLGILNAAGLALVPIGLFMAFLGFRGEGPSALVWMVILGNLGWVAASAVLIAGLAAITAPGAAFVAGQAIGVLVLALLEWRGLRQGATVTQ